jgi:hypothetical protein
MKLISTKAHGLLDYVMSFGLIAAPWIFTSPSISDGVEFLRIMGIVTLIYSMFTNYEWSIFKVIPFRMHLVLDILSFYFDQYPAYRYPHLYIGIVELFVAIASFRYSTSTAPGHRAHRVTHHRVRHPRVSHHL